MKSISFLCTRIDIIMQVSCLSHGQDRQIWVTPLPECQPSVSPPLWHRNRKVISTAHLRRSGQAVSEKGAEKERKGMEKILINKQEMNAAASKEGSIIDIDTDRTLNTVSGERELRSGVRSHGSTCSIWCPSWPLYVNRSGKKLKIYLDTATRCIWNRLSRQWREGDTPQSGPSSHGVEY